MMTSKTHTSTSNYECCMCGDLGLSHELFRCKVCHFRSQHRYCSNLYPKAESYRVCNWCLIQKDDDDHETLATTTTTSYNNSSNSNSSSPETRTKTTPSSAPATNKKLINHHATAGTGPKSPRCLQPTSPIKKPHRPSEIGSPSGRKRIQAQAQARQEEKLIRRTKSEEISNGIASRKSPNSGGPAVIKHVFRNKVRRYKLLDEVSS